MNVRVKYHVKKTPTRRKTFVDGIDMNEMQDGVVILIINLEGVTK